MKDLEDLIEVYSLLKEFLVKNITLEGKKIQEALDILYSMIITRKYS